MIHLSIPSIPPSANHAYETKPRKVSVKGRWQMHFIRILSEAGKAYKLETSTHLVRTYPTELRLFRPNVPYALFICFIFGNDSALVNKGYGTATANRYKKLDVGNRLKLFEDALAEASGIDDSHNWLITLYKRSGKADATHLWAWNMEDGQPGPFVNSAESLLSIAEV